MLPFFTVAQAKDGIDAGDLSLDLSEYMKKSDGIAKSELEDLAAVVATKLDREPQHKHNISDIEQLELSLASKYDTSQKYSYNVILSDSEKIPYLEAPKIEQLTLVKNRTSNGYKCYIDGRFVLFEYNSKSKRLVCDLKKEKVSRGVHTLKVEARDGVGNITLCEKKFKY